MYRHCVTEDTVQRQRQLEQCLLGIMARKRYGSISVRELCQEAGISRMAFYQYFDSKDGALTALVDHTLQDFGPLGCSSEDLERLARYWRAQAALLDAIRANRMEDFFIQRTVTLITAEDHEFCRRFRSDPDGQGELLLQFTIRGILSVILTWHRDGFAQTPGQITRLLRRMLLEPLLTA